MNEILTCSSLEEVIERVTGQRTVLIGDAILSTRDTAIGCETCEELFTPLNPSTVRSVCSSTLGLRRFLSVLDADLSSTCR
jgi:hypothetical protein